MSTLSHAEVAPFYAAFLAMHGRNSTLDINAIEQLITANDSDDVEVITLAMTEAEVDDAADIADYRKRFAVTSKYTDIQLSDMIMATSDDMSDESWVKYFETGIIPNENDDRSHDDANESDIPVTTSAFEYADKMDDELVAALETNAKAALEGKRGGAVIAAKLIKLHG